MLKLLILLQYHDYISSYFKKSISFSSIGFETYSPKYLVSIHITKKIHFFLFQASLLERREKIQQKHDEAKSLKDGIDRRSRLVTNILQKYLSDEQFDEYDHFIRMKSTLLIDTTDIEENIALIQKQIQILLNTSSSSIVNNQQYSSTSSVSLLENLQRSNSTISSSSNNVDNVQTNYFTTISTTA